MRDLNQNRFLIQSLYLQKTSGQGVRTHPPMVLLAMVKRGRYKSVGLLLGLWRLPSSSCEGSYIVPGVLFLSLMVMRYFMFVMMTLGDSMVIATLPAAVRNRGRWRCCQRSWEVIMLNDHGKWLVVTSTCPFTLQVMGRGPWQVVVISCKTRFTLVNDPDNYIRITHVGYPGVLWNRRIYGSRPDVYAL